MSNVFRHLSMKVSEWAGSTFAFVLAIIGVLVWLISGPYFGFSEIWLITITAITDVIIFVMVFSLQNTQNRDNKAIRLKLNELIASNKQARDTFIGLETLTDGELAEIDSEFQDLLTNLDKPAPPSMHKLHSTIKQEKAKRPAFYQQAEHIVDKVLTPLTPHGNHNDHVEHKSGPPSA
ncbi:MAG TPA: low affinity iron permease family protein [Candidatus Saccharimonadales bacterium]|nr:low affinity iron permease family protein [Candidatus Saccharimonadales bacterium]